MAESPRGAGRVSPQFSSPTPFVRVGIALVLVSSYLLARFQLNIGDYYVGFNLIALYAVLAALILDRSMGVEPICLFLFSAFSAVCATSWIVNSEASSTNSILLFTVNFLPIVIVFRSRLSTQIGWHWMINAFRNIVLFIAIMGILQFFLQFAIKSAWLFDFRYLIPSVLRNNQIYNTFQSAGLFRKANGFFLLEPSSFSVVLAYGLLCEFFTQKRSDYRRIGICGFAFLLSYSGSGLLVLFFGTLFPLTPKVFLRLSAMLIGALVAYFVLGSVLDLSFTVNRIHEFNTPGSSAYARFVAPFKFTFDFIDSLPWSIYIGHGPGTTGRTLSDLNWGYQIAEQPWSKLIFEYGWIGFLTYIALVTYSVLKSPAPIQLKAAFLLSSLANGSIAASGAFAIGYVLFGMWPREGTRERWALSAGQARPTEDAGFSHPAGSWRS